MPPLPSIRSVMSLSNPLAPPTLDRNSLTLPTLPMQQQQLDQATSSRKKISKKAQSITNDLLKQLSQKRQDQTSRLEDLESILRIAEQNLISSVDGMMKTVDEKVDNELVAMHSLANAAERGTPVSSTTVLNGIISNCVVESLEKGHNGEGEEQNQDNVVTQDVKNNYFVDLQDEQTRYTQLIADDVAKSDLTLPPMFPTFSKPARDLMTDLNIVDDLANKLESLELRLKAMDEAHQTLSGSQLNTKISLLTASTGDVSETLEASVQAKYSKSKIADKKNGKLASSASVGFASTPFQQKFKTTLIVKQPTKLFTKPKTQTKRVAQSMPNLTMQQTGSKNSAEFEKRQLNSILEETKSMLSMSDVGENEGGAGAVVDVGTGMTNTETMDMRDTGNNEQDENPYISKEEILREVYGEEVLEKLDKMTKKKHMSNQEINSMVSRLSDTSQYPESYKRKLDAIRTHHQTAKLVRAIQPKSKSSEGVFNRLANPAQATIAAKAKMAKLREKQNKVTFSGFTNGFDEEKLKREKKEIKPQVESIDWFNHFAPYLLEKQSQEEEEAEKEKQRIAQMELEAMNRAETDKAARRSDNGDYVGIAACLNE